MGRIIPRRLTLSLRGAVVATKQSLFDFCVSDVEIAPKITRAGNERVTFMSLRGAVVATKQSLFDFCVSDVEIAYRWSWHRSLGKHSLAMTD
jgi:hypothetical protein